MKRALLVLFVLFTIALVISQILLKAFPKNAGMMPEILVLITLDGYLWFSVYPWLSRLRPGLRYPLAGLFWLPLVVLVLSMIITWWVPFLTWNVALRTYIPGIILSVYVCKVFPILFLLIADIFRFFWYLMNSFVHGKGAQLGYFQRNTKILVAGWVFGGLLFALFLTGMFVWNNDYQVRKETVILPELPEAFDGLNIVQISDIHLGSWISSKDLDKVAGIVNSLKPDLVFFTGDIANFSTADVLPYEEDLSRIKAGMGIFAIMGNHDYGDYIRWSSEKEKEKNLDDLFAFYGRLGWKLLLNSHSILRKGSDSIAILGAHNWGKIRRFQRLGDVGKAQQGCESMAVQILLTHDPSNWEYIVTRNFKNIDLSFSGHTHGFQFGIECCGLRWSPAEYIYTEWAGLYSKPVEGSHPQYLYVNRGLGSLGYPGRIGILPEITQVILKKEKPE